MRLWIPSIEAADHGNRPRIGRPDAEYCARLAVDVDKVGAHLVVHAIVAAFVKEVEILIGEKLRANAGGVGLHNCWIVYRTWRYI